MSKLDWSKAKQREADPARAQRVNDFVEPDRVIISVSELTREDRKKIGQRSAAIGKARAQLKALLKRKSKPKPSAKTQQPPMSDEEKRRAREARRAAKAEHNQRYLAKTSHLLAEAEAKKKSHLATRLEKPRVLGEDRAALNRKWRSKLLGRREKE